MVLDISFAYIVDVLILLHLPRNYFHAVRVPKFHENETDKTGTLPVVNTVPGGGTPRSSAAALGWTELGTGPAKGPVVS